MRADEAAAVAAVGADVTSGATAIVLRAAETLRRAATEVPGEVEAVAEAFVAAQPSMAGLHTLAALARTNPDPGTFARFSAQLRRAPAAIARLAVPILRLRATPLTAVAPLRLVTCSRSSCVEAVLLALAAELPLEVSCAESRPRREGVGLAEALANAGIAVSLFSDAGISAAIPGADALLVGADAMGPAHLVNKVGTAALAARAQACGVPVYAAAGREKVLDAQAFAGLTIGEGPPDQVAAGLDQRIRVRNPTFESVPLTLVNGILTDAGVRHTSA